MIRFVFRCWHGAAILAAMPFLATCHSHAALAAEEAAPPSLPAPPADVAPAPQWPPSVRYEALPGVQRFHDWARKYFEAARNADVIGALESEGVELAQARRDEMARLIIQEPQQALALVVPRAARAKLPAKVVEKLEQLISARGEYAVLVVDSRDAQTGFVRSRVDRMVVLNSIVYQAHVFGRREGITSKNEMAIHGIVIGRHIAIAPDPVRVVQAGETLDARAVIGNLDKLCPICGRDASRGVVGDAGGVFYYFDDGEDLKRFAARIEAQEALIDPTASGLLSPPATAAKHN